MTQVQIPATQVCSTGLLQRHKSLFGRMLRFALVGTVVTGGYAASAYGGIEWMGMRPLSANLLGCAVAIIISYAGQKYFTFRSDGSHRVELPKFLFISLCAVACSTFSITVVTHIGLDYRVGILISAAAVQLGNFMAMNLWVFSHSRNRN
jgi:putative flippase GtrA